VITGVFSGIGEATAKHLAAGGAGVIIGRNERRLTLGCCTHSWENQISTHAHPLFAYFVRYSSLANSRMAGASASVLLAAGGLIAALLLVFHAPRKRRRGFSHVECNANFGGLWCFGSGANEAGHVDVEGETFSFTLMVAGTGEAEVIECLRRAVNPNDSRRACGLGEGSWRR
jgi:hypothetical protein